ncbi:MAG: oxidoreductase [Bacteroidales bacterium]|nr:oxidoreductase [Bacteroidales bacterium]
MTQKVILITGASSGIGYETAKKLALQGHKVYGAARRTDKLEALREFGVVPVRMDVTDEVSMKEGVDAVIKAEGRIDVLVNNAGYGYFGAVENVSMEEARRQVEVNVFGLAALTRMVLPYMREQHSGRIINTASIAGKAVVPFGGWYHVSKYSVEALSDALRMEMKPFGIDVVIIEPGGIKTDWGLIAAKHLEESSVGTAYEKPALRMAKTMTIGYSSNIMSKPKIISNAISRAVNARRPKTRYRRGIGSGFGLFLHAILPDRWWDALMRKVL